MINVNDIKNGMSIKHEGNIYTVMEFQHVKPGKGPAFVRTKLKNIRTGATIEHTFNTNVKFEKAMIDKKKMQFLYATGDKFNFMDMETYEQIELAREQIKDESLFLKEGLNVDIVFFETEMLGINLPEKVEYEVVRAEPAVKGNTTNNTTKEVELETGLLIKVPLFIDQGENIIVSTKDKKYDSRA